MTTKNNDKQLWVHPLTCIGWALGFPNPRFTTKKKKELAIACPHCFSSNRISFALLRRRVVCCRLIFNFIFGTTRCRWHSPCTGKLCTLLCMVTNVARSKVSDLFCERNLVVSHLLRHCKHSNSVGHHCRTFRYARPTHPAIGSCYYRPPTPCLDLPW